MKSFGYLIVWTFFSPLLYWSFGHPPSAQAQTTDSTSQHGLSIDILAQAERKYDVIVVGGSAGGASAAIQAKRMGASVALLAETNAIGGQLLTVSSIDEGWMFRNFPSGIYGELVNRVNRVYAAKGISVGGCYWDLGSRCYEPHILNQQFTAMLREANVDIYPRATFKDVVLDNHT
ncbi:MAG TPA: FAD-dependent oxidoreductase, partial [Bryobacteraceae bacterium]|nr:FAD-dependent oxidoreductase [Bryobacteraceae bacterium]